MSRVSFDIDEYEKFTEENEENKDDETVGIQRPRTANSIPNKTSFMFIKAPEINLEYQLPNSPEKYLLPIRFPILYSNIINSVKRMNKKIECELERRKQEELGTSDGSIISNSLIY
jgi:hypothetical protein